MPGGGRGVPQEGPGVPRGAGGRGFRRCRAAGGCVCDGAWRARSVPEVCQKRARSRRDVKLGRSRLITLLPGREKPFQLRCCPGGTSGFCYRRCGNYPVACCSPCRRGRVGCRIWGIAFAASGSAGIRAPVMFSLISTTPCTGKVRAWWCRSSSSRAVPSHLFFLSEDCGCAQVRSETRGCDHQGSGYHVCAVEEVRELPACGQTRCKLLFFRSPTLLKSLHNP